MGARGPQAGFKAVKAALAAGPAPSYANRDNYNKLEGEALKDMAHRMGISKSECERSDDPKLRRQLDAIMYRRYATEDAE